VKHLVFATGFGGRPKLPNIPGKVNLQVYFQGHLVDTPAQEDFKGEAVHSSEFTSAANYIGKKAVVVGACTSGMSSWRGTGSCLIQVKGHDLAQDFFNNGVDVTM